MKFLNRFKRKSPTASSEEGGGSPAEKPGATGGAGGKDSKLPGRKLAPNPDELRLELGDFLHRIPGQLLTLGPHDLKAELSFNIHEISLRIARGETTIPLSEIYKRLPAIFSAPVTEAQDTQVFLPWKKLAMLVNLARPTPGNEPKPADPAVENLAMKLRQKKAKAAANGAGTVAPEAADGSAASAPPILRGRGKEQASWFSKPTLEKEQPGEPIQAHGEMAADVPKSEPSAASVGEPMVSPLVPTEPLTKLKMPASEPFPNESMPIADAPAPVPPQLSDLPLDIQRQVAVWKGEYERQLSDLRKAQETQLDEYKRVRNDLERQSQKLVEEQHVSTARQASLEDIEREHVAMERLLEETRKELGAARSQSKVGALEAERDALQQQKAHLKTQIAELSKRGAGTGPKLGGEGANSLGQRQVEELQRRISMMEGAQRETALELAREKEAKAKVEKMLAAADKLQEQSANYMETAKAEFRREIETASKARENEARKAQKELQDQLTVLADQYRKVTVDVENARMQALEYKVAAEEYAAKEQAHAAAVGVDPMHAEGMRQLEEDVENYRERMKSLIRERDAARAAAEGTVPKGSLEEVTAAKAAADAELEQLRKHVAEQGAALVKVQQDWASAEERLTSERTAAESRIEAVRQALAAARDAQAAHQAAAENERASVTDTHGKLDEIQQQAEEARTAATVATKELEATRESLGRLSAEHAGLTAELAREQAQRVEEGEAATSKLREASHTLEQQMAALVRDRDEWRERQEAVAASLLKERAAHEVLLSNLDQEHTTVVRAKDELAKQFAEGEKQLRALQGEQQRLIAGDEGLLGDPALHTEIARLRGQIGEAGRLREEAARRVERAETEWQHLEAEARRLAADHETVQAEAGGYKAELVRLQATFTQASEALADSTARASVLTEEHRHALATLTEERDHALAEHHGLRGELSETRKQHQHLLGTLAEERAAVEQARAEAGTNAALAEERARTLEQALGDLTQGREQFQKQGEQWRAEIEARETARREAAEALEKLRQDFAVQEQHLAAAALARSEEFHRVGKEAAGLRQEKEQRAQQLSVALADLEKLKTSEAALRSEAETLRAHRVESEEQAALTNKNLEQALRVQETIKGELETLHQQQKASAAEAVAAVREMEAAKQAADGLKGELETSRRQSQEREAQLAAANEAVERTSKAEGVLRNEMETLRHNSHERDAQLAAISTALEEVSKKEGSLKGEVGTLREQAQERMAQLVSAKDGLRQAQADLEASRALLDEAGKAHESLKGEVNTLREQAQERMAQLLTAKDGLRQAQANGAALHAELETLREQHKGAEAQVATLRGELEQAKGEATNLRGELDAARRVRDELEKGLTEAAEKIRAGDAAQTTLQQQLADAQAGLDRADAEAGKQARLASQAHEAIERKLAEAQAAQQETEARAAARTEQASDAQAALQQRLAQAEEALGRVQREFSAQQRELGAARQERDAALGERGGLQRQRDDLLQRINRISEEQRRWLAALSPDLASVPAAYSTSASAVSHMSHAAPEVVEAEPTNVIEVMMPEVLAPEPHNGLNIPRIRPVHVPPPKVSGM